MLTNHHLPDVPLAAEIEKDGLNLGEMNKLLLKKVEELTHYLIAKDKMISVQQQEIQYLKADLKSQREMLRDIHAQLKKLNSK